MLRWQQFRASSGIRQNADGVGARNYCKFRYDAMSIAVALLLLFALGCSPARQQIAPPAPPLIGATSSSSNAAARVEQASAAFPVVPHHAVSTDPSQRPVSPRRYPIAVAPLRSYGCCH